MAFPARAKPWAAWALLMIAALPAVAAEDHWAWQRPVRPAVPSPRDAAWVRNPVDAFVRARLEAAGLRPAPPADRERLLRRVTLDLIGLPPTPSEADAFLHDRSPDAWEKVVNRLLASPAYGERWGRHWLDLARYADSNGFEHDEVRPDAWRYRDYVVRSLNADRPYDRFVREQLAGDELEPDDPDALVATGFNLLGPDMTDASDQRQRRQDTLNDMTDTAGLVFLGLTLTCARCHDHKFEPLSQADYYRFQAFFAPAAFRRDLPLADPARRAAHAAARRRAEALLGPLRAELTTLEGPYRHRLEQAKQARQGDEARLALETPEAQRTPRQKELVAKTRRRLVVSAREIDQAVRGPDRARRADLLARLRRLEERHRPAPLPVAPGLSDNDGAPPGTFLLEGGELGRPGEKVAPGFPAVLAPGGRPAPASIRPTARGTGRRAALARWIASPDNPLTARVLVNRVWQHHFGRGLVATPSDFGVRGDRPSHPQLLDWLAVEFVYSGWSLKHLHRLLLISSTYRQAASASPEALARDPDNRLLSRMSRARLEGEAVRDGLLAAAGRLDRRMGGPGVFPPLPAGVQGGKGWVVSPDRRDHARRSLYLFARRNLRLPLLEAFDLPDSNLSCPRRERSTTAPQALALLNAAEVSAAAAALAARLEAASPTEEGRIVYAYQRVLGRRPDAAERDLARAFLRGGAPLSELCRALFNLNEFVYRE